MFDARHGDSNPISAYPSLSLPRLRRREGCVDLIVDGEPFIALAGEVHNSSASDLEYMEQVWDRMADLNCNTAIVPIYWELFEPAEGKFDFTLVDGLIDGARAHGMRLVLLWFATWKNTESSYAPAWVKRDIDRFPRVQDARGVNTGRISAWSREARDADARAFTALMRHVRAVDAERATVLMVQVQNEVGLLGMSRDHRPEAERDFRGPVPQELLQRIVSDRQSAHPVLVQAWQEAGARDAGSWEEAFGDRADEAFMAWHIASFVEHIAASGKAEYPLPLFVNAWLVQHAGERPGAYPSGGPVAHMIDVWRAAAPSIDFLAPDIYLDDFAGVCAEYAVSGNPLFIPEARRDPSCAACAFYAIAEHDAIGFAPFGIESIGTHRDHAIVGPVADASLTPDAQYDGALLARTYELLRQLAPVLREHRGSGRLRGVLLSQGQTGAVRDDRGATASDILQFERYQARVEYRAAPAGGLIAALSEDEFLIAGFGISVVFEPRCPESRAGIVALQEGRFQDGRWIAGRRLNGDEGGVRLGTRPEVRRMTLYQWPLHSAPAAPDPGVQSSDGENNGSQARR